ncbi:MAG: DUF523 domain-containing protein [Erysipelotrichaceae bacterium]|nr:DUF523 domain-containing protein [Erysipelotrichaceae bacterium]
MKIGLSACLYGYRVRYDGTHKRNEELLKLLEGHELVIICPEFRALFPIPHEPLEIKADKVYDKQGNDVTAKLKEGSKLCLDKVKDCDFIILKKHSPSCGKDLIYDGSFSGKLKEGNGIFAAMCLQKGLKVFNEDQLEAIRKELL